MLRALAIASLALPVAVTDLDTGTEPPVALQKGDILCTGYDAASNTCLVKQLISAQSEDSISVLEEMQLTNFGTPLRLTTFFISNRKDGRYCLSENSIRAVAVPEIHHAAVLLTTATIQGLNRYAQAAFCIEHRRCGNDHVAIAYAGKNRFAEEDTVNTLLTKGNPAQETLALRPMDVAELDAIKGFAPVACLPPAE